ncbi:hypothetical protein U1Q18_052701 [Sarracenia purpurea var. burkii]
MVSIFFMLMVLLRQLLLRVLHFPFPVAPWLDRPSMAMLKLVIPSLDQVSSFECEACQFDKYHHSSFPGTCHSRQLESFNVVHTDIWVILAPLVLMDIHVIFIDDYSHMI